MGDGELCGVEGVGVGDGEIPDVEGLGVGVGELLLVEGLGVGVGDVGPVGVVVGVGVGVGVDVTVHRLASTASRDLAAANSVSSRCCAARSEA